jgi:cysteine desulfuration protein SufE
MSLNQILSNFSVMTSDEDRFRYLHELGLMLGPMPKEIYAPRYKIHGCSAQVWLQTLISSYDDGAPVLTFRGDSDSHVVRGLLAIVMELYSGQRAEEIIKIDASPIFDAVGLGGQLNSQRANGLRALLSRIKNDARDALGAR